MATPTYTIVGTASFIFGDVNRMHTHSSLRLTYRDLFVTILLFPLRFGLEILLGEESRQGLLKPIYIFTIPISAFPIVDLCDKSRCTP